MVLVGNGLSTWIKYVKKTYREKMLSRFDHKYGPLSICHTFLDSRRNAQGRRKKRPGNKGKGNPNLASVSEENERTSLLLREII